MMGRNGLLLDFLHFLLENVALNFYVKTETEVWSKAELLSKRLFNELKDTNFL